jgi:hypothetical protein
MSEYQPNAHLFLHVLLKDALTTDITVINIRQRR